MSTMKVVRVERTEFEVEDGRIFPIDPPLQKDMTPDEFQKHYDLASSLISSIQALGDDPKNTQAMGCCGEDQNSKKSR